MTRPANHRQPWSNPMTTAPATARRLPKPAPVRVLTFSVRELAQRIDVAPQDVFNAVLEARCFPFKMDDSPDAFLDLEGWRNEVARNPRIKWYVADAEVDFTAESLERLAGVLGVTESELGGGK